MSVALKLWAGGVQEALEDKEQWDRAVFCSCL